MMEYFFDRSYEQYLKGPEDFVVEELLKPGRKFHIEGGKVSKASGDFALCLMKKKERTSIGALEELRQHLKLDWASIGYAGLKDKHAVTSQHITLKGVTQKALPLSFKGVDVEFLQYTHKPLQRGEHAGNKFAIRLHGLTDPESVKKRFLVVAKRGMPNFFGPQRFGSKGDNHLQGRDILLGKVGVPKERAKFFIHAYQASVFNQAIAGVPFKGDVFMIGADSPAPHNTVEQQMRSIAAKDKISPSSFVLGGLMCRGALRAAWITPENLTVKGTKPVILSFTLPPGSYATAVLQRVLGEN